MRTNNSFLVLIALGGAALVACVANPEDGTAGSAADLSSLSLSCRYGNANLEIAGGTGTLTVSGQAIRYACVAPASTSGDVLTCTEEPTTLHTGAWAFAVDESGGTYTAVLKRPGTADLSFACTTGVTAADAGPPVLDASVVTDAGHASDASTAVASWAEVGPIIHATCDGCHHNGFATESAVKAKKSAMIRMISTGRMPRNNPGWKDTANGQEVLNFLQHSPDLD